MSAERAIAILDTVHELIGQMAVGRAMGLHLQEVFRRTRLILAELPRPDNVALIVNRLRSAASWYATRYVAEPASDKARADDKERLNAFILACHELDSHLRLQIGVRHPPPPGSR